MPDYTDNVPAPPEAVAPSSGGRLFWPDLATCLVWAALLAGAYTLEPVRRWADGFLGRVPPAGLHGFLILAGAAVVAALLWPRLAARLFPFFFPAILALCVVANLCLLPAIEARERPWTFRHNKDNSLRYLAEHCPRDTVNPVLLYLQIADSFSHRPLVCFPGAPLDTSCLLAFSRVPSVAIREYRHEITPHEATALEMRPYMSAHDDANRRYVLIPADSQTPTSASIVLMTCGQQYYLAPSTMLLSLDGVQ